MDECKPNERIHIWPKGAKSCVCGEKSGNHPFARLLEQKANEIDRKDERTQNKEPMVGTPLSKH